MSGEMGQLPARAGKVAVVASRFNEHIVEKLVSGALGVLAEHGIDPDTVPVTWVPGAFELPLVAERIASAGNVDAIIALGAVVRGGTPHFDYVCGPCADGLMDVALRHGLPVAFGVLTTDTEKQALERAGGDHGNKGADAALSALQTLFALDSAVSNS